GAAINCLDELTVVDSTFTRNRAGRLCGGAGGGAIRTFAGATIIGCRFEDNVSESGGAISSGGGLIVIDSVFSRNIAEGQCEGGGALRLQGTARIVSSRFEGNAVLFNPVADIQASGGA